MPEFGSAGQKYKAETAIIKKMKKTFSCIPPP
jgi:hypothetical protein